MANCLGTVWKRTFVFRRDEFTSTIERQFYLLFESNMLAELRKIHFSSELKCTSRYVTLGEWDDVGVSTGVERPAKDESKPG
jgi:hypothetical protein